MCCLGWGRAAGVAFALMNRRVHMPGDALKNKALQALTTGTALKPSIYWGMLTSI